MVRPTKMVALRTQLTAEAQGCLGVLDEHYGVLSFLAMGAIW